MLFRLLSFAISVKEDLALNKFKVQQWYSRFFFKKVLNKNIQKKLETYFIIFHFYSTNLIAII